MTWSSWFEPNEPKCWTKNIFFKGEVVLSCRNKRMLSIQEKELWIFDTTTTVWTTYYKYTIETRSENHLEPNVCGSTPVQLLNIFFSKMWTGSYWFRKIWTGLNRCILYYLFWFTLNKKCFWFKILFHLVRTNMTMN